MRLLIAVCCVVAWGGVASAKEKHFDTAGAGALSCAQYAEGYRQTPRLADAVFLSWTQGYISGFNERGVGDGVYVDMGAKTSDEMLRFLRKYCNDRPLADFVDAAQELLKSLKVRKYKDDASAPR
jgi:hypothetical protein